MITDTDNPVKRPDKGHLCPKGDIVLAVRTMYSGCMKRRTLGQLVRDARKQKGWTQEMMAEITGVVRSTITNIESGATKLPEQAQMDAIEKHLGLTKEEMLRAAGWLDPPDDDVLAALRRIDRLSTQEERLLEFRLLPQDIQQAVRRLAADLLFRAGAEVLGQGKPPVDQLG